MTRRILIAGVGNLFLGDDGFGVEVVRRLEKEPFPEGVTVADFGIRGLHLAYELMEPVDLVVIIDAIHLGEEGGTLSLLEPDTSGSEAQASSGAHGMDLPSVFAHVRAMGGTVPRVLLLGCEPREMGERIGLSAQVEGAVTIAAMKIREIVRSEFQGAGRGAGKGAIA